MKDKAGIGARLFMGLIFFVFGLNGFLHFIEEPEPSEKAGAFLGALVDSGYLMYVVKSVETVCGALLLANVFTPLALVLLTPIIVNIALFHFLLEPTGQGLGMAIMLAALLAFQAHLNWGVYKPMLAMKVPKADTE